MRSEKALFISGSMGLGHVVRDLAIAKIMTALVPALDIIWLAGGAAREAIKESGGVLHPRSSEYLALDEVAEAAASGYSLHLGAYGNSRPDIWEGHFTLFRKMMTRERYSVIVGDETYEIWFPLHDYPEILACPFVMLYDFIGLYPVSWKQRLFGRGKPFNESQAADHLLMKKTRSKVVFLGTEEDISGDRFGFFMPKMQAYAKRHYCIAGYALSFDPEGLPDRPSLRKSLGCPEGKLILVTIGGTAVGCDLLQLCVSAYEIAKKNDQTLQLMVVCGPRVDPEHLDFPPDVIVKGYVPRLYEYLAVCDLAITQAGGTTTLELTALRRPFLYFPLENHREQCVHVQNRLERHGAGIPFRFGETSPATLARAILDHVGEPVEYPAIDVGGAAMSAEVIASYLTRRGG